MGIILIIIGLVIWRLWAAETTKGQNDFMHARRVHDGPMGCLPYIIAFTFIGVGIYLLF